MKKFDTFAIRLKYLLQEKGVKARHFSNKTGVSEGNVSRWISKNQKPTVDNLLAISKFFTPEEFYWLLTGQESTQYNRAGSDSESYTPNEVLPEEITSLISGGDSKITQEEYQLLQDKLLELLMERDKLRERIERITSQIHDIQLRVQRSKITKKQSA